MTTFPLLDPGSALPAIQRCLAELRFPVEDMSVPAGNADPVESLYSRYLGNCCIP